MKPGLLELLVCIRCRHWLQAKAFKGDGGEITQGMLHCSNCGSSYPIIDSIPRILPDEMMQPLVWEKYPAFSRNYGRRFQLPSHEQNHSFEKRAKTLTSKSFGYEWKKFPEFHGTYRKQFLDWLGKIFAWVYGHEHNFVMVRIIEPFRKYFTSKVPHQILYYLCYPVTLLLELSCLLYRIAGALPLINKSANHLPSYKYLLYISGFSFRHKLAIVFDFLSAPLARYYRKSEFEKWFLHAGLSPKIYPHNDNSWKGLASVR